MECKLNVSPEISNLKLTSHDWYTNFSPLVIMDADGWRYLTNPCKYWYTEQISLKEFEDRCSKCTVMWAKSDKKQPVYQWPTDQCFNEGDTFKVSLP